MKAQDVTATLDLALAASGLEQMTVVHRPRLLSDNGASYVAEDLAVWLNRQKIDTSAAPPITRRPGQDRALASDAQEPHPARALLPARRSRTSDRRLRGSLQPCPLSREPGQSHAGRRLLRTSRHHPPRTRKDQAPDNRQPSLAASTTCRIISITDDPEPPFWKPAICLKSSDDGHTVLGQRSETPANARHSLVGHGLSLSPLQPSKPRPSFSLQARFAADACVRLGSGAAEPLFA